MVVDRACRVGIRGLYGLADEWIVEAGNAAGGCFVFSVFGDVGWFCLVGIFSDVGFGGVAKSDQGGLADGCFCTDVFANGGMVFVGFDDFDVWGFVLERG